MMNDLLAGSPSSPVHTNVCIVGAGAAGIVLAVELLRRGRTVTLLEGGGADVEEASQEPYRSEVSGLRHDGVHIGRFRSLGGSTTRWGGQILELDTIDFLPRPGIVGSGWPITKESLAPFYARAIDLEGLARATLQDPAVWEEIGTSMPSFPSLESFLSRWCPEPNFARLHHRTLAEHPSLHLWLHSNAVDLTWEGPRVRSVLCRTLSGIEASFTADHFVFCLGGIESSRFFLQPRVKEGPWLRSGLLGCNFQDHIICRGGLIEPRSRAALHHSFDNIFSRGFKYQPKLRLSPQVQQDQQLLNVAGTINFLSDANETTGRLKETAKHLVRGRWKLLRPADLLFAARHSPLLARQTWRYAVHKRAWNPANSVLELLVHCEQEPEGQSRITLSHDRDALGLHRTRLDWKVSELELRSIRAFVQTAQTSLESLGVITPDPDLLALRQRFIERCGDGYHHMGGMRMSTSPSAGLVDTDLCLHGMDNAFVCSSAVFPTSGFSNPTHTLLALAVRLAHHLSESSSPA